MPLGHWLGVFVGVIIGGAALGQDRGMLPPPQESYPVIPTGTSYPPVNPATTPGANQPLIQLPNVGVSPPSTNPPVKDLTPPGLAEHGPPVKDLTPPGLAEHGPPAGPAPSNGALFAPAPVIEQPSNTLFDLSGVFDFKNGGGFYADAELLLMRVRSDNLDYVIPNTTGGLATTGNIQSVNYNFGAGLRLEAGYCFSPGWDVAFGYTYFRTTGGQTYLAGPNEVLFPTMTRPGLTDNVLSANASASLNYNLYDMLIGRTFSLDEHSSARIYGGLRFADIDQNMNASYNGLDAQQAFVSSRSQFDGVGPIIGGELTFTGWRGLQLYARASGGLIGGRSSNPLLETNNAGATVYTNVNYNIEKVVPMASIGLGGGWEYQGFSIRFGYELTQWYGLTERARFTDDVAQGAFTSRSGSLSLEGLFIQLAMKY